MTCVRFTARMRCLLWFCAFAGGVAREARAQPASSADEAGAASLLVDLERIVATQEGIDWFLDQEAYADLQSSLLESVCRASEAARNTALARVREQASALGDPRSIFEEDGRRVSARFEKARSAARLRDALERAVSTARTECPYWVAPRTGFVSRQTDWRRWTLGLETGGNLQIRQTAGTWTFGGGGLARVLPSYGVAKHLSLLFGAEFGGGAMLRPDGGPNTDFVINYFPAIPVVLRFRDVNWRYDLEFGPVALFQADNTRFSYGGRIGSAIGVMGLRTRNLLPWAGIAGTYEYYFEGGGRPAAHFIRGGLRVGIAWDIAGE